MEQQIENLLNEQLALEYESSYVYLSMAAYFERNDYQGFAHWMKCQSKEELAHFHKIFEFIFERNGEVQLGAIKSPQTEFKSVLDVFKTSLSQEQKVTASIHNIYEQALKHKAYASLTFLNWFIEEQVEEEAEVTQIIREIERIQDNESAMFLLDRELGQRKLDH